MKHFFLISKVFYPDEVSTANLFTKLSAKIAENKDFKVDVWCAQPSYTSFERQPKHVVYEGINITYLRSTNFRKDKLLGRIINYITFTFSVIVRLLFSKDKTPVLTHTTPPSLGFFIAFICKLKGREFNYVLLDVFPDGLVRLGKMGEKNGFVIFWKKLNKITFKLSGKIIVIGRDMKKWLLNFYPDAESKVYYIPIWQDDSLIKPGKFENNPFVLKHNLQDKFVVQYSGNMGLWNDMHTIGRGINNFAKEAVFTFIGDGMRKKELLEVIENDSLQSVHFFPFLSNSDYSLAVTSCHVGLVTLKKGLEGMAVPSKIIGIMAAGIPVVAVVPHESEIAYIVEEEDCGIVVEPGNVEGLTNALRILKDNPLMRQRMGENGRVAFERNYTTSIVANQYLSLVRES